MERQKALKKLLSCVFCHEKFSKKNKLLIMFCGHNICGECKLILKNKELKKNHLHGLQKSVFEKGNKKISDKLFNLRK